MMSYENITQASTPSGRSQSVTHEKENTKQSNANFLSQKKENSNNSNNDKKKIKK